MKRNMPAILVAMAAMIFGAVIGIVSQRGQTANAEAKTLRLIEQYDRHLKTDESRASDVALMMYQRRLEAQELSEVARIQSQDAAAQRSHDMVQNYLDRLPRRR